MTGEVGILRRGFGIESCSLNCTFLHQYVISVSSTPLTKTVHECVWSSGVPGGFGLVVGSKSLAVVP